MARMRVGVLISGRGSNLKALIDAASAPDYPAEIVTVISNRPEAAGLGHAEDAGIPTEVIDHTLFAGRPGFEAAMTDRLRESQVDIVCLAGFMRVLTADFIEFWRERLINVHPSLLPAFPGLHTHAGAIAAGIKIGGCTVHYVSEKVDSGPIIGQAAVPVFSSDTPDTLAARVLKAEHRLYPHCLALVASGRTRIVGHAVRIADKPQNEPILLNPAQE